MIKWILVVILLFVLLIPCRADFISTDIVGHPRDIPDAGCYEYRADTALGDISFYIANRWLAADGNGDFNHDGVCNFKDYAILAPWWQTRQQ